MATTETRALTCADLKAELRQMGTDGDLYGTVMHWWFETANHFEERGNEAPAHWRFSPGAGGPEATRGDYTFEALDEATDEALEEFGDFLERAYRICKAMDWDY